MMTQNKITEIVNKIAQHYSPEKVILFGSYANGLPNANSDIDIIIIKNTDLPKQERGSEVRMLLWGSFAPLDIKVYTPDEFSAELRNPYSFLSFAVKNSLTLYERKI